MRIDYKLLDINFDSSMNIGHFPQDICELYEIYEWRIYNDG